MGAQTRKPKRDHKQHQERLSSTTDPVSSEHTIRSSHVEQTKFLHSAKSESDRKYQNNGDRSPPRKLSSYSKRTRRSRSLRKRSGTGGSAPVIGVRSHSSAISWYKDVVEPNHSL